MAAGVSRTQKQTPRLRKVKRSFIESLCVTIKAGGGSENDSNGVEKDHGGAGGGLEWVSSEDTEQRYQRPEHEPLPGLTVAGRKRWRN